MTTLAVVFAIMSIIAFAVCIGSFRSEIRAVKNHEYTPVWRNLSPFFWEIVGLIFALISLWLSGAFKQR
jgi:uncharacterized membrane protein YidH (DUF202 family)